MSDSAAPQPPAQASRSVVIETNSKVPVPKWPLWTALVVIAGLAAFTAIWFVANEEEAYTPGPVTLALVDSAAADGMELELGSDEARCIDSAADEYGITAEMIEESDGDVLNVGTEDQMAFAGTMMDDCLTKDTRSGLITASILADAASDLEPEQAACLGGTLDDAVMEAGGYSVLMNGGEEELAMELGMSMFSAIEECGIDLTDLMSMGG